MKRLFVTKLTSVGAVDAGDNPESRIMLFKRKPSGDIAHDKETLTMGDQETIAELQKELADTKARLAELQPEPDPIVDADPAVQKRFDEQQAEIVKLQKAADEQAAELAKERDQRITVTVSKHAETFEPILGDTDKTVEMLKSVYGTDVYDWFIEKMSHIENIIETADLFKELGVTDEADPSAKIESLAKEKQTENPDLTDAQARQLVRTEHPELKDAERGVS